MTVTYLSPFESLLAVEIHAPAQWVATAHLNGAAAAELFPLKGGASVTVCSVEGFAHHLAHRLYLLGILTLEELHEVPVRTQWTVGYVLEWARRFGLEIQLRSIFAVIPPLPPVGTAPASSPLVERQCVENLRQAVPAPGYAQLVERLATNVRGHLGDEHVRSVLHREGLTVLEPSIVSAGYLIGDVLEP